jgi:hypothetical protein
LISLVSLDAWMTSLPPGLFVLSSDVIDANANSSNDSDTEPASNKKRR